ncbi:glycosyltransferase [Caldibacillus thermoamylovorans]|uniref:glycosyltransferase n=1 Tax=Caldibacillus thermoamylovorans TaxID=35841 RepID=UPI0022DF6AEC|nr:glycosyltransferase [Caldibacillus thermoamylovorans]
MKTIVILSGVPYNSPKQRPHHFASYFSKIGYEVLYIYLFDYDKIHPDFILNIKNREQLLNIFSRSQDDVFFLKDKVNKEILKRDFLTQFLNKIIEVYGGKNVLFISAFPEWVIHLESLPDSSTLIYDCIDEWEEFIKDVDLGYTEELIYNERKIASLADLVITSAKKLYIKMSYFNKNIYYLPNGVWNHDYNFKEGMYLIPIDLKDIKQPIVFFMGAVAEWVDLEIIRFAAKLRPQYSFVFVGHEKCKLPKLPNIYFLGPKKYEELPNYLKQAKVAIIPFKVNNLTAAVTPLKYYEYLSSGTPVVTTIMPDIMDLKGSKTALDKSDFVNYLDFYINLEDGKYDIEVNNAKETAKSFDWGHLLKPILSFINGENLNIIKKETFIGELIQSYNKYRQNDLIKNELLNAYNLMGKYEKSVSLFDESRKNDHIDYEKLALSYIKINDYDQAIKALEQYMEKNDKRILKGYVDSLLSEKNYKILLEIYLLKLSGNIYEALELTDQFIQNYGMNTKLLGLLTGLYLDIGEYAVAFQYAIAALENLEGFKIEEVFDFYSISFIIKSLAEESEYNLAEEIALNLISIGKEWGERAIGFLSDIYISTHMG